MEKKEKEVDENKPYPNNASKCLINGNHLWNASINVLTSDMILVISIYALSNDCRLCYAPLDNCFVTTTKAANND
jgi:hypothetical protein